MSFKPYIIQDLFSEDIFTDLRTHVREVRRAFEGTPFEDINEPPPRKFNRWCWHNLPLLRKLHYHPDLLKKANEIFGEAVKPSYVFLSMYGEGGICPRHTDRAQCKYTIDMCISQRDVWPIYIDDQPYLLEENWAVAYSGTDSPHYRNTIELGNYCNLAFFHFVPVSFSGKLE